MTWSVSTFKRSSGATRPACLVKDSISGVLRKVQVERAHVDEMSGDSGGSGHNRADQMRAAAFALAALEIAIGGTGAALAGKQNVVIHPETHAAAGLAPLESG